MDALSERILLAKTDSHALESLISDYMPFIKKTVNDVGTLGIEYDDRLSLAMIAFVNGVRQYETDRGGFLAFAALCIRSRLIDESRRQMRYGRKVIPIFQSEDEETADAIEDRAAVAAYNRAQERKSLSDEIDALSEQLKGYGIAFSELPRICPKQERSRTQCIELGRAVAASGEMRDNLLKNRRLSQSELAQKFGISEKTVEKHRKYIVTIAVLLTGDYPLVRAFLPQYKEV